MAIGDLLPRKIGLAGVKNGWSKAKLKADQLGGFCRSLVGR